MFLQAFDFLIVGPVVPEIMRSIDAPSSQGLLIVSVQSLFATFSALISGVFSDHWGRKRMILTGLSIMCVGDLFMGFSSSFALMLVSRAFSGVGIAMVFANSVAYGADTSSYEKRGTVIGILNGAQGVSMTLGILMGTSITQHFSWHWNFWSIGFLTFVTLIAVNFTLPEAQSHRPSKKLDLSGFFGAYRDALGRGVVILALSCCVFWFGAFQGIFQNTSIFYAEFFNFSVEQVGWVLLLPMSMYIVGSSLGGRLCDVWGKSTIAGLCSVVVCIGMLAFTNLTQVLIVSVLSLIVTAGFYGAGEASLLSLISELKPEARGLIISVNGACIYGGIAIFTAVSSLVLDRWGFFEIGLLCGAFSLLLLPMSRHLVENRGG